MCAIFGIYNISNQIDFIEFDISDALKLMNYRGPDNSSIKVFKRNAVLAHSRLSIIDLNIESNQPFSIDDRYHITFNGEIFNYLELSEELINHGFSFKTKSDTEVLLNSFIHWGFDCVNRFNGMWSFVIYDSFKNEIFCSRDRFGEKPFNYTFVDGQFIFSSEIKSILAYKKKSFLPNYKVIANFIRTGLGAQFNETWFDGIFRLPPAHNLIVNSTTVKSYRYWDYPKKVKNEISEIDAINTFTSLFNDAVRLRMRSDVPIGITLSSGVDSTSILVNSSNKSDIKTYTAHFINNEFSPSEKSRFKDLSKIDETIIVKNLVNIYNCHNELVEIDYSNYVEKLRKIIWHLESGHNSPAIFPLNQVYNHAKKDVKVVLEGQGADELLGGYVNYIMPKYLWINLKKLNLKIFISELKEYSKTYSIINSLMLFVRTSNLTYFKHIFYWFSGVNELLYGPLKNQPLIPDNPNDAKNFEDPLNAELFKLHDGGLVNLLHYGDSLSMANSIESRLPFTDYRLVEFVFSLPSKFKIRSGMGKYILRKSVDSILPNFIVKNPIKLGFDSPLSNIFRKQGSGSVNEVLLSDKCLTRGLFNPTILKKLIRNHLSHKNDNSRLLFRILMVELWFNEFID